MAPLPSRDQVEAYIRQSAVARGVDPDIAVRVARSEGLGANPAEAWQSTVKNNRGLREPSYGPFQLLVGGGDTGFPAGMGNDFMQQTGLDPRNPGTWQSQIDFALNRASEGGWSPWYGAAKVGVGRWDGVRGAKAQAVAQGPSQPAPQASAPVPGSMAPNMPPLDPPRDVATMRVSPVQERAAANPMPAGMPPPPTQQQPSQGSNMAQMMALLGSMSPQQQTPAPQPVVGPSPEQANALSSLVAALRKGGLA